MKKKHRDITVNDQAYAWSASYPETEAGKPFKIWKNKVVVHEGHCVEKITPSGVKAIIEKNKL